MNLGKIVKHLIFWILFILIWSVHDLNYHEDILENIINNIFSFAPYALLVYVNLYVLIPVFLLKKRIFNYVILLLQSIVIVVFSSSAYLAFYFKVIIASPETSRFFASTTGKIAIATEVVLALCLSMTLFLIDEWYRKDRFVKEIKQKQIETELNLLKNQINPHFLFNSLNSIYVMLGRNQDLGKKTLLQFSELLSHQLYETKKEHIALAQEFENLKNYIAIEKIRHEDLVDVECVFPENIETLRISPMLLLPLVENAFKHGQSSTGYWIKILVAIDDDAILNFMITNSVSENTSIKKGRGIGLTNVKRRLELIYPDKHLFTVEQKNAKFIVHLKTQLCE